MNAGLSSLWGPDPVLCLLEMVGPSSLPSSGSATPRDSACPSGPHLRPPRLQEPGHPQRSPGPSDGRSVHPFCILIACRGSFRTDAGWAAAKLLPSARAGPLPLPWARQIRARLLKPRGPLPSQADPVSKSTWASRSGSKALHTRGRAGRTWLGWEATHMQEDAWEPGESHRCSWSWDLPTIPLRK